jgi:NADH-quinone oxidoreductase subunit C
LRYTFLANLTAFDDWPEEPRFNVIYQLREMSLPADFRVQVRVPGDAPELPTATGVYLNANWHEREVYDMFGLTFTGHPDLRRILMPSDWQGHPLRKDYPLGYEEVEFTFNFKEIEKKKPYAKE